MTTYTLTLIDVRQVQRYVFSANELKQIVGASELVEQATHHWVASALPRPHNLDHNGEISSIQTLEHDALQAEVLFTGGGNVAILFESEMVARTFAQKYTLDVLANAPGLAVAIGHVPVQWETAGALAAAWDKLHREVMPVRKEGWTPALAVSGLSVTAQCAFTGGAAVAEHPDSGVLISAEIQAKLAAEPEALERLKNVVPIGDYQYPLSFEELGGERGRASYVAVVHADGNNMGNRLKQYADTPDNREMVLRLRDFSRSVNACGRAALAAVCRLLIDHSDGRAIIGAQRDSDVIHLRQKRLPLRPLVFGGDDVTFVCDGRLGLALAARFLEAFDDVPLADGKPGYACAGIAIIHTNYPFARAYALAEDLCHAAKLEARKLIKAGQLDGGVSLLQWHYAVSGLLGSWEEIHLREYQVAQQDLTMRPFVVASSSNVQPEPWRTWKSFGQVVAGFRQDEWAGRRNKLKALRTALRTGEEETRRFTTLHGELPPVAGLEAQPQVRQVGYYGQRCVYFDAIEADDLLMILE